MTAIDIRLGRVSGKDAAAKMLSEVSHEAACQFWRANACADTLHAYGYWDGFLTILSERRTT